MEIPSGNPLRYFMTTQKPRNWGSKVEVGSIFMQDLHKLGSNVNGGVSHAINVQGRIQGGGGGGGGGGGYRGL